MARTAVAVHARRAIRGVLTRGRCRTSRVAYAVAGTLLSARSAGRVPEAFLDKPLRPLTKFSVWVNVAFALFGVNGGPSTPRRKFVYLNVASIGRIVANGESKISGMSISDEEVPRQPVRLSRSHLP